MGDQREGPTVETPGGGGEEGPPPEVPSEQNQMPPGGVIRNLCNKPQVGKRATEPKPTWSSACRCGGTPEIPAESQQEVEMTADQLPMWRHARKQPMPGT